MAHMWPELLAGCRALSICCMWDGRSLQDPEELPKDNGGMGRAPNLLQSRV